MNGYFSFPLLSYNLKSRTKNFIIWALVSLCLFILIVVMFTNLLNAGLPDFINDMLASMPTSVSGGNEVGTLPDFTDFGVNFGVCMQLMLIVGCIYASYLGASANSGSRGESDITFIYSMPLSRPCTVLTSFFAQLITLVFHNAIVLLVSLAVLYSNHKMMYIGRVLLAIAAFLLIEAIYLSLSFLFSTFMNNSSQAASISAVFVTITVVFSLIGSLSPALKLLTFLSPYSYISVSSIIVGESRLYLIGIAAGILISLLSVAISCIRYEKIDLLLD